MVTIAIIPARGGSKGIKRKNIKKLAGKPLIAYTIKEAKKSIKLDRIIVSTENEEIAKISKHLGAEVSIRPIELAQDETPMIDIVFHTINQLKDEYDKKIIIILLQPTSPLRTVIDIDNSIELFLNTPCNSLISVCEMTHPPYWSYKINKGYIEPLFDKQSLMQRRQEYDKIYNPNGAIYISKYEALEKYKSFLCEFTIPYIMPTKRSIDIDDEIDFLLAEILLKKQKDT